MIFLTMLKISHLSDVQACMHFLNAPLSNQAKSAPMRLKPINYLSANVWKLLNQSLTRKVTLFPWTKWPPFCRRYFHKNIREWKFCILIKISLKSVPKGLIDKNPALVEIMACHYLNQSWSNLLTHICGTRGRCVEVIIRHGTDNIQLFC